MEADPQNKDNFLAYKTKPERFEAVHPSMETVAIPKHVFFQGRIKLKPDCYLAITQVQERLSTEGSRQRRRTTRRH